jgi:hypothetical protein
MQLIKQDKNKGPSMGNNSATSEYLQGQMKDPYSLFSSFQNMHLPACLTSNMKPQAAYLPCWPIGRALSTKAYSRTRA